MSRAPALVTLAAVCLAAAASSALLVRPFDPERTCCDHLFYRSMSFNLFSVTRPELDQPPAGSRLHELYRNPHYAWLDPRNGLSRQPPFVYRVATPLLARAVAPLVGIDTAYRAVSLLALAGAAFFVGLAIFEMAGALTPALAGALVFLENPFTARFNLYDYMLVDPAAFLLSGLAIWALVKRRPALFYAVCAAGVLNKESMLPMLVAYPLSSWWLTRQVPRGEVLAALAIAAGWILLRAAIPIPVDRYSILGQLRWPGADPIARAGLVVAGVLTPALLRRPWGWGPWLALLPFTTAALLAVCLVDNPERAMAQALPAVCVGIFWRWPRQLGAQLLALAPLPLSMAVGSVYALQPPHPLGIIAGLCLLAAAAELGLWRTEKAAAATR